ARVGDLRAADAHGRVLGEGGGWEGKCGNQADDEGANQVRAAETSAAGTEQLGSPHLRRTVTRMSHSGSLSRPEHMNIAIVGGAGTVGREAARVLAERGHAVRVLSRKAPDHPVDLSTGEGLADALAGV